MYEYHGSKYTLVRSAYNGTPDGYCCDGVDCPYPPKGASYVGYIRVGGLVIFVYKERAVYFLIACVVACLILAITMLTYVSVEDIEYRVSFASSPVYSDGVLYCNIVNVAEQEHTVYVTDGEHKSSVSLLAPGQSLPTLDIDFIPTSIVYDDTYSFPLEVSHD